MIEDAGGGARASHVDTVDAVAARKNAVHNGEQPAPGWAPAGPPRWTNGSLLRAAVSFCGPVDRPVRRQEHADDHPPPLPTRPRPAGGLRGSVRPAARKPGAAPRPAGLPARPAAAKRPQQDPDRPGRRRADHRRPTPPGAAAAVVCVGVDLGPPGRQPAADRAAVRRCGDRAGVRFVLALKPRKGTWAPAEAAHTPMEAARELGWGGPRAPGQWRRVTRRFRDGRTGWWWPPPTRPGCRS